MNFIDLINKYKNKIKDKTFLVEYDLFFDINSRDFCKFAIDDSKELKELDDTILRIKEIDKSVEIYVNTYEIIFIDKKLFIYSDTLWINTEISLEDINKIFKNTEIEPGYIDLLSDVINNEEDVELVISSINKIEDYDLFINKRQLSKIKSLYWN